MAVSYTHLWKDRWNLVDWKLNDWDSVVANRKAYIKSQGSDVFKMLNDWKKGKNHSWEMCIRDRQSSSE